MEKKLTTNDMNSLLCHVIKTIDRWWVEKTDRKQGYFTRSKCVIPDILYQRYVEWRFALTNDSKEYESLFISLDYENRIDYIRITLKKMKVGVYTVYDPFCEIYDGKTEAVFSEQTGFGSDNILRDVINTRDFDELIDKIANTVHMFVTALDEDEPTITAPAGLTTKEVFVLDKDYFKIGDIYCLHIHPEFQGEVNMLYTGSVAVNATLPKWVYAICSDVCDTAIEFTFKRADEDSLVYIQIHTEDIEKGLIEVTRQLCNETLIQDEEDKNEINNGTDETVTSQGNQNS